MDCSAAFTQHEPRWLRSPNDFIINCVDSIDYLRNAEKSDKNGTGSVLDDPTLGVNS